MEAAGAVFLPAAGKREPATVNNEVIEVVNSVNSEGYYWSSTHDHGETTPDHSVTTVAHYLRFFSGDLLTYNEIRVPAALSVRPVKDAD